MFHPCPAMKRCWPSPNSYGKPGVNQTKITFGVQLEQTSERSVNPGRASQDQAGSVRHLS